MEYVKNYMLSGVESVTGPVEVVQSAALETPVKRKRPYKERQTFLLRQAEAQRIQRRYPDRLPVIVERAERSVLGDLDKQKYLVADKLTVGQFQHLIRRKLRLAPEQALFLFFANQLEPTHALMCDVYRECKDRDGFLYARYDVESTFG